MGNVNRIIDIYPLSANEIIIMYRKGKVDDKNGSKMMKIGNKVRFLKIYPTTE